MTNERESLFPSRPLRVRFTRRVPTIHLTITEPFEGERRLTTLCGATAYATVDSSNERVCVTCERRSAS